MFKNRVKNSMLWSIAIPILLGNLAQTAITLIDTAFLGRLGEVELGAASMTGIYYYCFTTLAWGFAIGAQIIIARRVGQQRFDRINYIFQHSLIFILPFALIIFAILKYGSPYILGSFISSENVYNVGMEFISYRSYGIFFASINFIFNSFYIGLSKTRAIAYSTLIMGVVNAMLNYVLIFGSPFNEPMGVKGAAIASVCAEVSATIFMIIYTAASKPIKGYPIFRRVKFEPSLIVKILRISLPTMFQKMFSYGAWLAFFLLIENMGERSLAVTMVVRSAFMLIVLPAFAFAATANTVTSRLIGEGRDSDVISTVWQIIRQSTILITIFVLWFIAFPSGWLGAYTDNPDIIAEAKPIILQLCGTAYLYAISMAFFEAVSGTGHTKFALYIEMFVLAIYVFVTWLFASYFKTDLFWVWTSEVFYTGILAILCWLFMKKYKWHKQI